MPMAEFLPLTRLCGFREVTYPLFLSFLCYKVRMTYAYLTGSLGAFNELIYIKFLERCWSIMLS